MNHQSKSIFDQFLLDTPVDKSVSKNSKSFQLQRISTEQSKIFFLNEEVVHAKKVEGLKNAIQNCC